MSSIARKSLENFAVRISMQAFAIGGAITISRLLGPSGKGFFVYATTVLALILTATAGQSSAIAWQYAQRHRPSAALLRTMRALILFITVPLCAGLVLTGVFVHGERGFIAVAAALPFAVFAQSATGLFLADTDVRSINVQQVLTVAVPVAAYVPLLIWAHAGIAVVLALWAAGYALSAAYTALRLRPYERAGEPAVRPTLLREQVVYGVQVSLNSTVSYLNFRIDVFLIMLILGQSALGVYSIGIGIGEMLWQLSRPLTTASFGRIARGDRTAAAQATATCMRHSFALVLLAAVAAFFAAPVLVPIVYGRAFTEAAFVTRVLLPGIIAYSMMPALAAFFAQQLGQPRLPLLFSSVSMALCAGLTALLLPHYGIVGGAIATSISYVTAFAAAAWYFIRTTGATPAQLFVFSRADLLPYRALLHV